MTNSGSKKVSTEVTALRKQVSDLKEAAVERRRVETAVRASEELYRGTVDQAPVGILRLDPNGKVLLTNPAFVETLGYSSRQDFHTIGNLRGIFAEEAECRRVVEQVFSAGARRIEVRCRTRDGAVLVLLFRAGSPSDEGVTLIVN
jgi:PAS domain S-box-containing protein